MLVFNQRRVHTVDKELHHGNFPFMLNVSDVLDVAGDAYLGTLCWEKAEAEALTLKNHLESVTILKLTAEVRASHLDGALKECMSADMEFERTQTKIA
ncbi:hypothetical protein RHMOL_Rhmol12G0022800 [Rhododendron molle]|uniref:Uncharacterized protein n=1 Tax=Rhododendron molle TaxID=49168 RepID=A0ACC0LDH0_RHOML|nr:hypothetical protein RHMOL_Rhmol12G0022800 [Rhododendron molle]